MCQAAASGNAATVAPNRSTSLAVLLAGHVLQDGELVLLIIKPSLWFIVISALRFIAVVLILMISAALLDNRLPGRNVAYQELGLFAISGRIMWSVLQWMGRVYVLTDMRIVRLSGVFSVDIFDCPLRKIRTTRMYRTMRERLTRIGSIEIIPADETSPLGYWQSIRKPAEVHEQIVAAINRAKQGPGLMT